MQTQLVRGQSRRSVLKKIESLSAQGWRLQGDIKQETGFGSSTRYAATMVWGGEAASAQANGPQAVESPRLTWAIEQIQQLQARIAALEEAARQRPS